MSILLLSIVGVVISVVIGMLWYSTKTPMGKVHMQYIGFDKLSEQEQRRRMKDMKPMMPRLYGAQMFLSLLTSIAVVFIVTLSMQNGVPFGMAYGFIVMNWLCFMVPVIGANIIWGNVDKKIAWKKFLFDSLSNLVTISSIAVLVGLIHGF